MEPAKKNYNFLIPQYAVAEVFLAALLYIITFWLNIVFVQASIIFAPFLVVAAGYAGYATFKNLFLKKGNSNELVIIQIIGLVLILNINLLYIYESFFRLNLYQLTIVDYCFLAFSAIVLIRFLLLAGAFTFGNKVSLTFILLPPKAKIYLISPILFAIILVISLFFYFNDLSNLRIATAQAFLSAFCVWILFNSINITFQGNLSDKIM